METAYKNFFSLSNEQKIKVVKEIGMYIGDDINGQSVFNLNGFYVVMGNIGGIQVKSDRPKTWPEHEYVPLLNREIKPMKTGDEVKVDPLSLFYMRDCIKPRLKKVFQINDENGKVKISYVLKEVSRLE